MSDMVSLTIDGVEISVPKGTLVVDAAKKIDIEIPVFCYHPKLDPVGMCRMCLVEIGMPVIDRATGEKVLNADGSVKLNFGKGLQTGCTVAVSEGMVVRGNTIPVQDAREDIIEFLLTSHPLDCPICDKGGECPLQNLTMAYGRDESRMVFTEKMKLAKHVPLGEIITLDELVDEVGADAARFFFLLRSPGAQMDFDLDLAVKQSSDNPVFYVQYAHARACSVMRRLAELGWEWNLESALEHLGELSEEHEKALMRQLDRYPEIVANAAVASEPHGVATYLRELAGEFHTCYNAHKVLVDEPGLRNARVALCQAVRQVIANGLDLLGVTAPETM